MMSSGVKICVVVAVVLALASVHADAAVFGINNIMHQRYPNGPREYQEMEVPVVSTRTVTRAKPQPDSSWMTQRKGYFPVARRFHQGSA